MTVDGTRENVVKRGRRNVISRHYHAKDDKEAIVTWRLDFNGVWHVFNVRPVISMWQLITLCFQTELRIDTRGTGPDVRSDVGKTRTTASNVHRTKLKSREGADYQTWAVSTTRTLSPSKYLPLRLTLLAAVAQHNK